MKYVNTIRLVLEAIESHVDKEIWEESEELRNEEREELQLTFDKWLEAIEEIED